MTETGHGGFTRLEFVIVVALIAVLAAVALSRFYHLSLRAEAVGVQGAIGTLRSALSVRMSEGVYRGADFRSWLPKGEWALYPMRDLLDAHPEGYLGVVSDSDQPGAWFDDRKTHELVYVPRNNSIVSGLGVHRSKQLRWRLKPVYSNPSDPNSSVMALQFTASTPHRWASP